MILVESLILIFKLDNPDSRALRRTVAKTTSESSILDHHRRDCLEVHRLVNIQADFHFLFWSAVYLAVP